jgi:hypothetical protein
VNGVFLRLAIISTRAGNYAVEVDFDGIEPRRRFRTDWEAYGYAAQRFLAEAESLAKIAAEYRAKAGAE